MRLLISLRALANVELRRVSIVHKAESLSIRPWPHASQIQRVSVDDECSPPHLPFVATFLTWRHQSSDSDAMFSGMILSEVQIMRRMGEQVMRNSGFIKLRLETITTNGQLSCEAQIFTTYPVVH